MAEQGVPGNPPSPDQAGITAAPAPAPAPAAPAAAPLPPRSLLRQRVADGLVNVLLIGALWVVAGILLSLYGFEFANAVGFGFLAAFFGAFLVRPTVNGLLNKARPGLLAISPPAPLATPVESAREVIETVVFVVVLVLLLKSFVAEAFVIPTGSMAQTLFGYQKNVVCPECAHRFPVNASNEVENKEGHGHQGRIDHCVCPNCRKGIRLVVPGGTNRPPGPDDAVVTDPGSRSGDRVLVAKYPYDLFGLGPTRLDVVVFKFPGNDSLTPFPDSGPFGKNGVAMNYIKRLIGLPGETVAIHRGKVFLLPPSKAKSFAQDEASRKDPWLRLQMWQKKNTHASDDEAMRQFKDGEFAILRKRPAVLLEMMRLVYDNDKPAKDLAGEQGYQRWVPGRDSGWVADEAHGFRHGGAADQMTWLRYRHVLRGKPGKPQLITDFLAYNTFESKTHTGNTGTNWASDLIAECEVAAEKAEGRFAVELSRADSRFQAVFEPATGDCTLYRLKDGKPPRLLGKAACRFKGTGTFRVRFANCDDRLSVWVNGSMPFGDGVSYDEALTLVPTVANDLDRPVSLGAQGGRFAARHLKLMRDTFYVAGKDQSGDVSFAPDAPEGDVSRKPWTAFADSPLATYYVQPGHYLCLGDNSPESSDSRYWGLVPQRLLLGRAVLVYFPFTRVGRIR